MEQIQQSDSSEDTCKILIGNKCDLNNVREVKEEEGEQLAREYDIPFMETSAKDSLNVDNLFYTMAIAMKEKAGVSTSQQTETKESCELKGKSVGGKKKCEC
ncbi:Ras-related protein RABD1 [Histomonas meleagridis]|uniref:Ras-related protein RABD1 n=1 Tax=Histomonas meleagridis TaxID=135588 RepID=UPI00355A40EF|nr:Ras-related protein RABD1 [Histomonas meleagridis]KAH0803905.1 Ras-related protein RABD1 [Histomonas meleagridis]